MREHDLKVWPAYFDALASGEKTFEVRKDDRDFQVGDILLLREWAPSHEIYTGRSVRRFVTYKLTGFPRLGIKRGFCVLGIIPAGDEVAP